MKKILLVIFIIAALLRFVGINPGYNQYHADEGVSYSGAVYMIKGGNFDPSRYDYPALVPFSNFIFFKLIFVPLSWLKYFLTHIVDIIDGNIHIPVAKLEADRIFQMYILGNRDRNSLFWGRAVTALFSFGSVVLTYILAKKLFNRKIAMLSIFLLAFNYKHVINSKIGLPDVYNSFYLLLAFIFFVNLWKKPSRLNYLLAGIGVGLSFSVKYQIFAAFPFVLVHLFASFEKNRLSLKKLFSPNLFISIFAGGMTFLLINPYFVIKFNEVLQIVTWVSQKYGMGRNKLNLYPFWYFYNIDYGPIEFFLIIIGFVAAFLKFTRKTLLLFAHIVPFFFAMIFLSKGGFYIRNFITTTPILMIMAAVSLYYVYKIFRKKLSEKATILSFVPLLAGVVFVSASNAITVTISYTKPWLYDQMRPWISQNLPTDVIVATHPFDASNLNILNKATEFELAGNYSLMEHVDAGAKYAIYDLNYAGNPFYYWMIYGPKDLKLFWNKPYGIMRNSFHGLAAEELFRYQVYSVTRPWQAPDTNLLIIKFPDWPEVSMHPIKSDSFGNGINGWKVDGRYGGETADYRFDKDVGHNKKGSASFIAGGIRFPTLRLVSSALEIKPGHLYKVSGFLKSEMKLGPRQRDGFLRLDFYSSDPGELSFPITSSLSSRLYGPEEWAKKIVVDRAPDGARLLTVSFQVDNGVQTNMWFDDLVIEESFEAVEDITSKAPYIKKEIDLNLPYPNSHGNL